MPKKLFFSLLVSQFNNVINDNATNWGWQVNSPPHTLSQSLHILPQNTSRALAAGWGWGWGCHKAKTSVRWDVQGENSTSIFAALPVSMAKDLMTLFSTVWHLPRPQTPPTAPLPPRITAVFFNRLLSRHRIKLKCSDSACDGSRKVHNSHLGSLDYILFVRDGQW